MGFSSAFNKNQMTLHTHTHMYVYNMLFSFKTYSGQFISSYLTLILLHCIDIPHLPKTSLMVILVYYHYAVINEIAVNIAGHMAVSTFALLSL